MLIVPSLPAFLFIGLHIGCLLRLAWVDYHCLLLPDRLTYPLLWSGLLYQVCFSTDHLSECVIGAIAGYMILWMLYWIYFLWRKVEGIGHGDMKLLAALGAWHGWQSLGWIIFAAAMTGLIWALITRVYRKNYVLLTTTPLPFGPNLAIAGGSIGWICTSFPQFKELSFLL
ncbi:MULTISPECIES: prepilin peptidase [Buttiauxella]|jgi:leader peptidase HopD|uniref:Type IV leader peptidase n=1 Tax=Buttiauxella ferragutiae ATCC 51602 TaxID=1354252 RepID=A0ABX2WB40_9ENTR|nr:prepilin peptidase [Buttiauxella sp. 3AFRM03]OAT29530.1 type IV leader peptidase [Buttiauxella ferragutiae ATCC 51602]TDN52616.1 leader peptidase HopD [Buttiauxella sp. JUb87]